MERRALLEGICTEFGVELLWHETLVLGGHRDDTSVHSFFAMPGSEPIEETKHAIRQWVERHNWQFSRQMVKNPVIPGRRIEYIVLAPMIFVQLERAYHATRLVSVPSILSTGLVPSTPERQTTHDRTDCESNIYVCEALGTPADAGVGGSKTAHWWRDHLAQQNRFNDPNWVILEVDIGQVQGAKLYRDIWSDSGIIVGGVAAIPPGAIQVVYEPSDR